MDDRQQQIREGAGLTESKLNVEFIDFLRKWSTPFLLLIAAAALGVVLYQRVERARAEELGAAFRELETATSVSQGQAISPASLKGLADTYEGVRSVAALARLRAADEYMRAVRAGKPLGAGAPGADPAAEQPLAEEDRTSYLAEAEALYQQTLTGTAAVRGKEIHAVSAAFGLAAVAESRGELDKAKAAYDRALQLADRGRFTALAEVAKKRAADLQTLAEKPRLFAQAELPAPPAPPAPPSLPAPPAQAPESQPAAPTLTPPSGQLTPPGAAPAQPAPAQPTPAAPAQPAPASQPK